MCSETPSSVDAALGGGLAVALGVGGGEVQLGGGARVVRAQVDVVVGQHRSRRIMSATRRSCGVVTLKFAGEDSTTRTLPPARSTSQASSVARRQDRVVDRERGLQRRAPERLRRLHRPQPGAVERRGDDAVDGLLDRVGHARRRDRAVGVRQRGQHAREQLGLDQRPRRVVDDDVAARRAARERGADRLRARRAAAHADAARRRRRRPQGSATTIVARSRPRAARPATTRSSAVRRPRRTPSDDPRRAASRSPRPPRAR